jgi:hypothetical protein
MLFFTKEETSILKFTWKHTTPNNKTNPEQNEKCWNYQNTRLQIILQTHSNKDSMVLAKNRYENE